MFQGFKPDKYCAILIGDTRRNKGRIQIVRPGGFAEAKENHQDPAQLQGHRLLGQEIKRVQLSPHYARASVCL